MTQIRHAIGKQTDYFVSALEGLIQVEDFLLSGYGEIYGDGYGPGEGPLTYQDSEIRNSLEILKDQIKLQIGNSIESNLGDMNRQEI